MFQVSEQEIAEFKRRMNPPRPPARWLTIYRKGVGHFYIGATDETVYLKAVEHCADVGLPRSAIQSVRGR